MSRRGSITGSFPSTRPINTTLPSLVHVDGRLAATENAPLSDPEDEGWSDDDVEDGKSGQDKPSAVESENRGRTPTRSESSMPEMVKDAFPKKSVPVKAALPTPEPTVVKTTATATSSTHADGLNPAALPAGLLDRKRAVSSSSAFGSRARVKQHNTARRRRPLSFHQAIESLLDRSKDFCHNGHTQQMQSSSLREGTADIGVGTNGHLNVSHGSAMNVQQNSAPAEFSLLDAPSVQVISPGLSNAPPEMAREEEDRRSMPPPPVVPRRAREVVDDSAQREKKKESRFFMAGQSVDDSASSVSGSLSASLYSPKQLQRVDPFDRPAARRVPSDAASDHSQRRNSTHRGQQSHPHGHSKASSHGIAAGARNRSAVGLSRAAGGPSAAKGKGSGRVTSGESTASTKRSDGQRAQQQAQQQDEPSMTDKKEKDKTNKKQPVKFTLSGGDDDGDDEFTDDDSSEEEEKPSQANRSERKAPTQQSKSSKGGDAEEDEDEWSSASSTDSEELQRRVVARRKQEEVERQQSMFQKVPIKSASTVDVRNVVRRSSAPIEVSNNREVTTSPTQPVRGLLSSLFHPEDAPHPPPGQLAGRPHASAADLRMKPSKQAENRALPSKSDFRMTPIPSTTQVPSIGGGALKLSKSAVALPVLSTMGSRSEAKKGHEAKGSRDSAVFTDEESAEGSEAGEYGTSEALARLNKLAYQKKEKQREGKRQSKNRHSNKSLNVEVAPEIDEETLMAQRRREASMTAPVQASARPGSQIPETSMPQTPRTTRRNMLRDELSESLRQSLLWERQSRNRMLGIGALDSNPRNNQTAANDSRSRSMNRNQTVLGGGQLRPLTSSSSVTNVSEQTQQQQQRQQRRSQQNNTSESNNNTNTAHRSYTGDFHHAGW
jgi:hypothetical protein